MASAALGTAYRHLRDLFAAGSTLGLEDGQLLARYSRSNDPAAFEALVSRHGPMVLATCRAVLRNEHDVEDAFQATFLVLARKAGSVRGSEALGGWLHRVAYRASVRASIEGRKRRQKEAEAAMARRDSSRPESGLAALLHEEIDRLPGSLRLPVVLCDLEGLSYEEAAGRLGWTVPSLRHRLSDGRQKLKGRLARRGALPLAAGATFAPKAQAAVPPALVRATVALASGSTPTASVALLTHTLLKGMLMTKIKFAEAAALAALALASAGVIAAGGGRPLEEPKPAMEPKAEGAARPAAENQTDMVEVKGRVVDPDGRPVAGASVCPAYIDAKTTPFPRATSLADGRFTIRVPRPTRHDDPNRAPWLLATAPGFGPGWTTGVLRPDRAGERVVTLVEQGTPIEGWIVDLEGRPVAAARVEVRSVMFDPKGDLSGWIARARNGTIGNNYPGLDDFGLGWLVSIDTKTGDDGRFRLAGLGRDRIASLLVSRPGVASTQAWVMCRDEPEITPLKQVPFKLHVHAPRFQLVLPPGRRVEGVARDKDSGKPIADLAIKAGAFDEYFRSPATGIEARTDAEGRYRLDGLPRAEAYRLFVSPRPNLPYTDVTLKATSNAPALEPVAYDFALKRGVVLRGKVTDKVTGEPVRGNVFYFASADNPHAGEYPGFSEAVDMQYARIQDDGRYEIIALPGSGLLAVMNTEGRYRAATGLEAIKGYDADMNGFITMLAPIPASGYNLFAETNFDPKADSATVDLQLDPGKSVTVQVVGPDGRPLGGTKVDGLGDLSRPRGVAQESAGFEVQALDPSLPRRVTISHAGLKLVGSVVLKGEEAGPVTIRLVPWGTIVGRVVNDEGRPRKDLDLASNDRVADGRSRAKKVADHGALPDGGTRVDNDGRFRIEGLVPGLRYGSYVVQGGMVLGDLFKDVTVAPGEVKDLGDLKVRPPGQQ